MSILGSKPEEWTMPVKFIYDYGVAVSTRDWCEKMLSKARQTGDIDENSAFGSKLEWLTWTISIGLVCRHKTGRLH